MIVNDEGENVFCGLKVAVSHNKKGKGKLVISYANLAELDDFIAKIK